ncbi:hypothetical protein SCOCK_50109 [Actinacidiphila cocklensis]|uniref:Uncharacterized protein n=1 Tax=Actinacidiphila cocklensis TaxID=887465 RepID=A0A9W4GUN3_9ACTN|nr:hypothetical protein SCOCK_50109 [Actinacidiphila cocklensis]
MDAAPQQLTARSGRPEGRRPAGMLCPAGRLGFLRVRPVRTRPTVVVGRDRLCTSRNGSTTSHRSPST